MPRFITSGLVHCAEAPQVIDLHKWMKTTERGKPVLTDRSRTKIIEFSELAAAAETYRISADFRDFIVVEMPLVTADVPNRNMDLFPMDELTRFDWRLGRLVYKTFIGKPTFINHDNKDPLKARGINFDSLLRAENNEYGVKTWKVRVLSGFDRTKDPDLAKSIKRGERHAYSMGAMVDRTHCSVCRFPTGLKGKSCACGVGAKKGSIIVVNGMPRLKCDVCSGVNFIENSSVPTGADHTAVSNEFWG